MIPCIRTEWHCGFIVQFYNAERLKTTKEKGCGCVRGGGGEKRNMIGFNAHVARYANR